MKRFLCALTALITVLTALPLAAHAEKKQALPFSAGIEALRGQFEDGIGPGKDGKAIDYRYYSPVGENDTTKYPLVVFIHGIGHGEYEGSQLDDSDMPYWSSAEYQARFDNAGGAFIMLPRSHEEENVYWTEDKTELLHAAIKDFVEQHRENIDTRRIAISGSSAGGAMVWYLVKSYPGEFATAFPLASTKTPSNFTIKTAHETAFWILASKRDPIVNYQTSTLPVWKMIIKHNDHPENCRLSTFEKVYNPDGTEASDNHHLAKVITCDLHTYDGAEYPDLETVDGLGNTVDLGGDYGLIKWISNVYSDNTGEFSEGRAVDGFLVKITSIFKNGFLHVVHLVQSLLGL